MFYAGNGQNLIAFQYKDEADYYVEQHPAYMREMGNKQGAYDYPQYRMARQCPNRLVDCRSNILCRVKFDRSYLTPSVLYISGMSEDWL